MHQATIEKLDDVLAYLDSCGEYVAAAYTAMAIERLTAESNKSYGAGRAKVRRVPRHPSTVAADTTLGITPPIWG